MKKLNITITLGMEVPDHWELIKDEDGIDVIDLGDGRYLDLTFTSMMTDDYSENAKWINGYLYGYRFADSIVGMLTE